jgi:hypothetical protein
MWLDYITCGEEIVSKKKPIRIDAVTFVIHLSLQPYYWRLEFFGNTLLLLRINLLHLIDTIVKRDARPLLSV